MSDLIAPRVVGENVLCNKYKKIVVEKTFLLPNGTTTEYLLWGGTTVPSVIFPVVFTETGVHVLAERQFRYGANEFVIEVPGGNPDDGEGAEDVAIAELLKETGYKAEKMIQLGGTAPLWFEPAAAITPFIPMLAWGCKKVAEPQRDADEIMETLLIPLAEWKQMIRDGRIRDTKTIAVTMMAFLYLEM